MSAQQPHSSKSPKSTNSIQQVTPVKASTAKTPVVVRRAMEGNAAVTKVPFNSLNELSKASPKSAIAAQKSTADLQTEATHPSSGGPPKTLSKTRSGAHPLNVSTAQKPKNDASLASHPSTATEPAALPPKGRQPAITPAANLEHLGRIIDSVVAGLDDYSASQYTPNDYVIEPPRASVTELSFRDFEKLEVAMKHEKERRSSKRPPPPSVDVDEAGDSSPDDIFSQNQEEPARRKKKSKVGRSSDFEEEFPSVAAVKTEASTIEWAFEVPKGTPQAEFSAEMNHNAHTIYLNSWDSWGNNHQCHPDCLTARTHRTTAAGLPTANGSPKNFSGLNILDSAEKLPAQAL
ncbi:unnamed protein product [Dibothriocephalus latus]|uniref:Uncharacterized protein n=1 Tax=Dibothriocephalus latus TaxID=60516 RepID=A0A3P7L9F3_DIBLA|nr:unnamed protein product [Dibothriocephalus latus]